MEQNLPCSCLNLKSIFIFETYNLICAVDKYCLNITTLKFLIDIKIVTKNTFLFQKKFLFFNKKFRITKQTESILNILATN